MPITTTPNPITTTPNLVAGPRCDAPRVPLPPTRRVVTGLTASGRLHLGNYLGAILPLLRLTGDPVNHALVFVADLHALTVDHDPHALRAHTREMAATLLACGLGAGVRTGNDTGSAPAQAPARPCSCSPRCRPMPSWATCYSARSATANSPA